MPNGQIQVFFLYLQEGCVSDTCIGIPKEYHEKIFERLYQVDSEVGKGSRFCFTLPLA